MKETGRIPIVVGTLNDVKQEVEHLLGNSMNVLFIGASTMMDGKKRDTISVDKEMVTFDAVIFAVDDW